jgi:amidase
MRLLVCLILSIVAANAEENYFTVSGIHNLIRQQQWSCLDVVRTFLQRSEKFNGQIKAIISFNQNALKEAELLDKYFKLHNKKFTGKLHCIPILVKDNVDVKDIASTAGVNALNNSIPRKDALVVSRLKKEGSFTSKTLFICTIALHLI